MQNPLHILRRNIGAKLKHASLNVHYSLFDKNVSSFLGRRNARSVGIDGDDADADDDDDV